MSVIFIDGNELRAAEIREVVPGIELVVEALSTGFATSAPEPEHKARDKVLAHAVSAACFAEAVDLTTMDGKSLRLDLDSENPNRFCKHWRETPVQMHVRIAVRRAGATDIEMIAATWAGCIANAPAGPLVLGWDRLFYPDGERRTVAELTAARQVTELRREVYTRVARTLGLA